MVTVDFHGLEVLAGDILFISPGRLHSIWQLRKEIMEYENIIFPLSILANQQGDAVWTQYLEPIALRKKELTACLAPDMEGHGELAACIDAINEIQKSFPFLIKGKLPIIVD